MPSDDSNSDIDSKGCTQKNVKLLDEDTIQLSDKNDSCHSLSLIESKDDNALAEGRQNDDDTNELDTYYDFNSQNSNYNQSVSSEESNSDNIFNVNNYGDSGSEDYVPISDSEFELEKLTLNNETNCKKRNSNEKTAEKTFNDDDDHDDDTNKRTNKIFKSAVMDNDEVYDLLDKAYQDKNYNPNENIKKGVTQEDFKEYEKVVLEEICKNHFDILPENWIEATHKSGMPIYLHKKSRVVTLSRPYFLGPGDPKSHLAPLSAISCLQYRKSLESKKNIKNEPDFQVSKLGNMIIPNAKVETAQENIIKESLTHEELREYCRPLFK